MVVPASVVVPPSLPVHILLHQLADLPCPVRVEEGHAGGRGGGSARGSHHFVHNLQQAIMAPRVRGGGEGLEGLEGGNPKKAGGHPTGGGGGWGARTVTRPR